MNSKKKYWVIVDPVTGEETNVKLTDQEVKEYERKGYTVKFPTPNFSSANPTVKRKENAIIDIIESDE